MGGLELAGGVRGAGKRWLTGSLAKLVTRSDAVSAPEAEMRLQTRKNRARS